MERTGAKRGRYPCGRMGGVQLYAARSSAEMDGRRAGFVARGGLGMVALESARRVRSPGQQSQGCSVRGFPRPPAGPRDAQFAAERIRGGGNPKSEIRNSKSSDF